MRNLLCTLALLCLSGLASAQCASTSYANGFTCIKANATSNAGSGSTATATLGSNAVAGHQMVVMAFYCFNSGCGAGSTTASIADGASDAGWVGATGNRFTMTSAVTVYGYVWVLPNVSATTTFTVTCSVACFYLAVMASEWTGIATSTPIDQATGGGSAVSQTTATMTTGSTTNAVDLLVSGMYPDNSVTLTAGSGFNIIGTVPAATYQGHEAKSVSSTGAQSCTWSFGSTTWAGLCAAIKSPSLAVSRRRAMVISR